MTAYDVQLTDYLHSANVADREPAYQLPRTGAYRDTFKRVLDVALILISAPVVVPIILVLALCVALGGGKPFYSQQRVGRHGKTYRIWKLRTMVVDADAALERHLDNNPEMRSEWDSKQKLLNDPRITPLGKLLRKCSIDELPQLWNVLRGDMSLVGPRPMMVEQKEMYPGTDYYDLRPGITGFWQISDRNKSTFADRAHFDAHYNAELSFATDLKILFSTVRVVVHGTGY